MNATDNTLDTSMMRAMHTRTQHRTRDVRRDQGSGRSTPTPSVRVMDRPSILLWPELQTGPPSRMFVDMRFRHFILLLALTLSVMTPGTLRADAEPSSDISQPADYGCLPAPKTPDNRQDPERAARILLLGAKDALSSGKIVLLRPSLGKRIHLNFFTGINGYYSAEQAFRILESHFSTHKAISFSFSSRNFSVRNPYGFGPLTYEWRGRRQTAEMFLSLALVDDTWVINQITITAR